VITWALFCDEIHRSRICIALEVVITSAFQTVSPAHAGGSVISLCAGHADNGQVATSLRHAFDLTVKFDAVLQLPKDSLPPRIGSPGESLCARRAFLKAKWTLTYLGELRLSPPWIQLGVGGNEICTAVTLGSYNCVCHVCDVQVHLHNKGRLCMI
jgi:hypothetical protein